MTALPAERLARHTAVRDALAGMSERELLDLLDTGRDTGRGIGGSHTTITVLGAPVFAKRIVLTDPEREPGRLGSTADQFGLPDGCHYGVGSPGFGAWRELAANELTIELVLHGRLDGVPLLHHWRVLPGALPPHEELADIVREVAAWHDALGVRRRFEALASATATIALFTEHVPRAIEAWLKEQLTLGDVAIDAALERVERGLIAILVGLRRAGILHLDAHLGNVRTDGQRIFLTDLGLATADAFTLTATERTFIAANRGHDLAHALTRLVDWTVIALGRASDWQERDAVIERVAHGAPPPVTLPPGAAALVGRYAPLATVINRFYRALHLVDRRTPFPTAEVEGLLAGLGL